MNRRTPKFEIAGDSCYRPFELNERSRVYRSESSRDDGWGRIELHRDRQNYCLRCSGVADFFFARTTGHVTCFPNAGASADLISALVHGPVRAILFELRGLPCLHSSAVMFGEGAVGFIGHSGYGKSTLAASLIVVGHALITDDVLPVSTNGSECVVYPGEPSVRLKHDVVAALPSHKSMGSGPIPGYGKRSIRVNRERVYFCDLPVPLTALYVLNRCESHGASAVIEEMAGVDRLVELLRFSYCARAVEVLGLRQSRFALLGELARRVPVRLLRYASGLENLTNVQQAITRDLSAL